MVQCGIISRGQISSNQLLNYNACEFLQKRYLNLLILTLNSTFTRLRQIRFEKRINQAVNLVLLVVVVPLPGG